MCLVFLRWRPEHEWPVLLLSIRDEELARRTAPPGHWWPERPTLLGGRDELAGGTWLAADVASGAVAAVFTADGPTALDSGKRSRGELPAIVLADGGLARIDPTSYGRFALLQLDAAGAIWWSWRGEELTRRIIDAGDHIMNVHGLDAAGNSPRQARWFGPLADTAPRTFDPMGGVRDRWPGWTSMLDLGVVEIPAPPGPVERVPLEQGEQTDELMVRRGGYGTKSVTLLAVGAGGVVWDSTEDPTDAGAWHPAF